MTWADAGRINSWGRWCNEKLLLRRDVNKGDYAYYGKGDTGDSSKIPPSKNERLTKGWVNYKM
jgi:hypothetical protein